MSEVVEAPKGRTRRRRARKEARCRRARPAGGRGARARPARADVSPRRLPAQGHRLLVAPQDGRPDPPDRPGPPGRHLYLRRGGTPLGRSALGLPDPPESRLRADRSRGADARQVRGDIPGRRAAHHGQEEGLADVGHGPRLAPGLARARRPDVHPARDLDAALPRRVPGDPLPMGRETLAGLLAAGRATGVGQHPGALRPRADRPDLRADRRGPAPRRLRGRAEAMVAGRPDRLGPDGSGLPRQSLRPGRRPVSGPARVDDGDEGLRIDRRAEAAADLHRGGGLGQRTAPGPPDDDLRRRGELRHPDRLARRRADGEVPRPRIRGEAPEEEEVEDEEGRTLRPGVRPAERLPAAAVRGVHGPELQGDAEQSPVRGGRGGGLRLELRRVGRGGRAEPGRARPAGSIGDRAGRGVRRDGRAVRRDRLRGALRLGGGGADGRAGRGAALVPARGRRLRRPA